MAFLGLALVLIPVPGPDFFFMLTTGMRYHAVLRPVAGVAAGHLMLVALVVVGLGPLVSAHPVALKVLTVVGGLYLLYLGATVLRSVRSASFTGGDGTGPESVNHLIRQGFGVAALNPKSLLFYAAILPQFVRPGAGWPVPLQFSVLSVVFLAGLLTFYAAVGMAGGRLGNASPRIAQIITAVAGGVGARERRLAERERETQVDSAVLVAFLGLALVLIPVPGPD
ncbi:hypothetical protein CXF31_10275, partial [Corynebacterium bovis]